MGLARFELAFRSPEPRRMDQATPQSHVKTRSPSFRDMSTTTDLNRWLVAEVGNV